MEAGVSPQAPEWQLNSNTPAVRASIAAKVDADLSRLADLATEAIWAQVPAYRDSAEPGLRDDVTAHVTSVFRVFLAGLADDRPVRRGDFEVTREQATHRVAQGISLAEFLRAFHIGQLMLWQGVLEAAAADDAAREAALGLVAQLMQVIELGSTVASEAFVQAQQHELAERDRLRRDLVEDLLARRAAFSGQKLSLLRTAGLGSETRLVVVSAVATGEVPGQPGLPEVAATLARAGGGLAALRQDEIVGIIPLRASGIRATVASVRRACAGSDAASLQLAAGVSTVHSGLHEVAEAYTEARVARDGLGPSAGFLALPLLSAFDYLVLQRGQTAGRLLRQRIRRFVADDAAAGGTLIATLVEYAACDLNATIAAERLHLHVNTAYYRLERIAERTGCDLRRLSDVMELLIAIKILGPGTAADRPRIS